MSILFTRKMDNVQPPEGVKANPSDAFSIPLELIVVTAICLLLTSIAICGRIWSQAKYLQRLKVEDYSLIAAIASFVAFVAVLLTASTAGLGEHAWDVMPGSLERVRLLANALDIIYGPMMLAAKISVLLTIGTFFFTATGSNAVRRAVWGFIAFNGLSYTALLFVHIVACNPRSKIADPSRDGTCISQDGLNKASGAINLVSSITVFLLALAFVRELYLAPKRKVALCGLYLVGVLACVGAAGKLFTITGDDYNKGDFTKAYYHMYFWAIAEFCCTILVACLPLMTRHVTWFGESHNARDSWPRATHSRWVSPMTIYEPSAQYSSKTRITRPTMADNLIAEEAATETVDPPKESMESIALPHRPSTPLDPTIKPQAPHERPVSHVSYESYMTASIAGMMHEETPMSPVSETTEYFSMPSPRLHQATQMTLTPIKAEDRPLRFANITKTVDVRVSNHTNNGSPVYFNEPRWT